MLTIDGSAGEGGGQILRTSLALSLITQTPFRIQKIRANRDKPGLRPQHVTAVTSAARIGDAEVTGAAVGSRELVFRPGPIKPGGYEFDIGTAGSVTLVLQTVLPPLLSANEPSSLVILGGTHNLHAPPFDFLDRAFLPLVNRLGHRVRAYLDRPGFYPAGGGQMSVVIEPGKELVPLELLERGALRRCRARAMVARLPRSIAERELSVVRDELQWDEACCEIEEHARCRSPGNALFLELESEHVAEVFTGFGQRGVRAEAVAASAIDEARDYLNSGVPIGRRLADQLLLPLSLAKGGSYLTAEPTPHTKTNIEVIRQFLDTKIELDNVGSEAWRVTIGVPL